MADKASAQVLEYSKGPVINVKRVMRPTLLSLL